MLQELHAFTSAKGDGADATLVRPGNWNATHSIGQLLTNRTGGQVVSGDLVTLSAANDESVILADTASAQRAFLVAKATINDVTAGLFVGPGNTWTCRVAGATTRGNWLVKSATSKAADESGVAATSTPPVGALGIALTGSGGAGTVVAFLVDTTMPGQGYKGTDIASASTVTVPRGVTYAHITGTTTITAIGTLPAGYLVALEFDAALTITHNATTLILQGGVNYVTIAGDVLWFVSEGSGNWRQVAPTQEKLTSAVLSSFLSVGTNPAASGPLRVANAAALTGRNAANSADKALVQLDSSDRVTLSDGTQQIRPNGPVRCDIDNKGLVLPNTYST